MTERRSQLVALALTLTLVFATMPVYATDLNTANAALGSVSGAGNVQVRGVSVQQESTLFSNDRVRTGPGAYAKLNLANGARLELSGSTELVLKSDNQGLRVNLISGAVTMKASTKTPITVVVSGHEVRPIADSSVKVAMLGTTLADVQVVSGRAELKNTANKETITFSGREGHIVNLTTGKIEGPLTQVASAAPAAAPAAGVPPAPPASNKKAGMIAMFGTAGGAAAAITWLKMHDDDGDAAASSLRIGKQLALQDVAHLLNAASAASSTADQVISTATLIAVASPADAAAANAIKAAATATKAQIQSIITQLESLSGQINAATNQTQLNVALAQIVTLQNQLNQQINNLNVEVAQINALAAKLGVAQINPAEQVLTVASASNP